MLEPFTLYPEPFTSYPAPVFDYYGPRRANGTTPIPSSRR